MKTRPLGGTGIDVTEISFGAWSIGGATVRDGVPSGWSGADEKVSIAAVQRAWEVGINFFDTADVYGRGKSEVLIGLALYEDRHKAIIASKAGRSMAAPGINFTEPYIKGSLDCTLTRLERSMLDIYLLHCPPMEIMGAPLFDVMREMKASGKIRAWGASVYNAQEAVKAIQEGAEVVQLPYNILVQDAEKEVFPLAREKNVGIIVREALASGWLTGKYNKDTVFAADDHRSLKFPPEKIKEIAAKVEEFRKLINGEDMAEMALRYVLSEPAVSTIIVGCKNPAQVDANITAAGKTLPPGMKEKIQSIFA